MTQKITWTRVETNGHIDYMAPLPEPFAWEYQVATHLLRWYNREERSWVTSYSDELAQQIGSSQYDGTKADADASAEYLLNQAASITAERNERRYIADDETIAAATVQPVSQPKMLKVGVYLRITINVDEYQAAYGRDDLSTIRNDVKYAVLNAVSSGGVLADGITNAELR